MSPVGRDVFGYPLFTGGPPKKVIELGERMGVPDISWGSDNGTVRVVFHWEHGDRVIYPSGNQDLTEGDSRTQDAAREKLNAMTYTPRPGDIGLTSISGAGGAAIRLGQWLNGDGWTRTQHAFVYTGTQDRLIAEAMPGGARVVPNWHKPGETVYLRCPDEYRDAVAAAATGLVGTPYSALDYVSLAAHRFHLPAPHLRRYIKDTGHMICSQLADEAALRGGWHLFEDGRWSGDVTPNDLYRLYTAQRTARMAIGDTNR